MQAMEMEGTQSAYSMKDPKVSMKFMGGNSTVLDVMTNLSSLSSRVSFQLNIRFVFHEKSYPEDCATAKKIEVFVNI